MLRKIKGRKNTYAHQWAQDNGIAYQIQQGYHNIRDGDFNSFDEEGEICQHIIKWIYESEDRIKKLPKGYTIVDKVGYRDNEDLSEYQNINKINTIIRVSQDIINMDSSTEGNIDYWDKDELIRSRELWCDVVIRLNKYGGIKNET